MSGTILLGTKVEQYIREKLERDLGQPFESVELELSNGGRKNFDAVSRDRDFVYDIKTHRGVTRGGRSPTGGLKSATAELFFLSQVDAKHRGLVLTNRLFHEKLTDFLKGPLPKGMELKLVKLPSSLARQVDAVLDRASREQRSRNDRE